MLASLKVVSLLLSTILISEVLSQSSVSKRETQLSTKWSNWEPWSTCHCSFRSREKERRRTCQVAEGHNENCKGHEIEHVRCHEECTNIKTVRGNVEFLYFRDLYLTHTEAQQHCKSFNGSLALIKNWEVHSMISEMIRDFHLRSTWSYLGIRNKDHQYHIGLRKHIKYWKWEDGTIVSKRAKENETVGKDNFEMWTENKNYETEYKCAAFSKSFCRHRLIGAWTKYTCWEKIPCSTRRLFICQRELYSTSPPPKAEAKRRLLCPTPKCKRVKTCPLLPVHNKVSTNPSVGGYHRFRVGDVVNYSCSDERYQLVGTNNSLTCEKEAWWSTDSPTCKITTDCDFSFGLNRLCWYTSLPGPWSWVSREIIHRQKYTAFAQQPNSVLVSHPFTATKGPRCLKFTYKLIERNPWLEVTVGNYTFVRGSIEKRGDWKKVHIGIAQADDEMRITFRARNGGVFVKDITVSTKSCKSIHRDNSKQLSVQVSLSNDSREISPEEALGCDFEDQRLPLCHYTSFGGVRWINRELCQCAKLSHAARVSVYGEDETVLRSPSFLNINHVKCLQFLFSLKSPDFIVPKFFVQTEGYR